MRHLNIADLFPSLFNFIPRPSDHHSHNHQPTNLHSVTKLSKWFSVAQHLRTPIRARSWHPLGYAKERIRLASRTDSTPRKTQSRCAQRTFMWHGLMEFVAVVRAARRIRTTVRELRIPLHNFPSVELCRVVQEMLFGYRVLLVHRPASANTRIVAFGSLPPLRVCEQEEVRPSRWCKESVFLIRFSPVRFLIRTCRRDRHFEVQVTPTLPSGANSGAKLPRWMTCIGKNIVR